MNNGSGISVDTGYNMNNCSGISVDTGYNMGNGGDGLISGMSGGTGGITKSGSFNPIKADLEVNNNG